MLWAMHKAEWKHAGETRFRAHLSNALWLIHSEGYQPIFDAAQPIDRDRLTLEITMRAYDILELFARIKWELQPVTTTASASKAAAPTAGPRGSVGVSSAKADALTEITKMLGDSRDSQAEMDQQIEDAQI